MRSFIFYLLVTTSFIATSTIAYAQTPELAAVERYLASGRSNAMPVNESTVTRYFNAMDNVHSQITVAEVNRAQNDPAQQRALMQRLIIAPLENMGFSFDDTMQFIVWALLTDNYTPQNGPLLTGLIAFPAQSADMLAELGLVSPTTHQLLQQLNDHF